MEEVTSMDRITAGSFYTLCSWVTKIAYVNLLWIVFSVAGLLLLGIMPATIAICTVVRKWFLKDPEFAIFPVFVSTYKQEFFSANKLGFILLLTAGFLLADVLFLQSVGGLIQVIFTVPLIIVIFLLTAIILYVFPVYVHFEQSFFLQIKNALLIAIVNPLHLFLMMITICAVGVIYWLLPSLIPFFGISLITVLVMFFALKSFASLESRQKESI